MEDQIIFDPAYQQNMYLIESAMKAIGAIKAPEPIDIPDIYDEQLSKLIEAVPLE